MFGKLLMLGIVLGVGAYYYDLNTAEKKLYDARFDNIDTEMRCRNNHESMCKYFVTVKLEKPEKLEYKFRVPRIYFHQIKAEGLKERRFPVLYKAKKIFPATILGLKPEFQKEIDKQIEEDY